MKRSINEFWKHSSVFPKEIPWFLCSPPSPYGAISEPKKKRKKKKGETIPFLISRCFTSHVEQIIHFYCILPNALLVSHFWRLTTVKTLIKPISPITNIWILPKAISSVYRYTGGHSFPFPSPHKQIPSLVLGCPEDYCISRVVFFFFVTH